jgi:hypothetical protein
LWRGFCFFSDRVSWTERGVASWLIREWVAYRRLYRGLIRLDEVSECIIPPIKNEAFLFAFVPGRVKIYKVLTLQFGGVELFLLGNSDLMAPSVDL